MTQTLAPVTPITRKPRPSYSYEAPARLFLASGFGSEALRERALAIPQDAETLLGTADALDAMAVPG